MCVPNGGMIGFVYLIGRKDYFNHTFSRCINNLIYMKCDFYRLLYIPLYNPARRRNSKLGYTAGKNARLSI